MVTLFMACLFGMFLFSYLYLVRNQKVLVSRSQAWNGSIAAAEAGVEEALAQLNPGITLTTIDRTANGWGTPSGGLYGPMARSLPAGGSYGVVYTTDPFPTVYSTGYVSIAYLGANISRVVRVTTTNAPVFNVAMAAKLNIDFKGNGIATDSFNSALPTLSSNGMYVSTMTSTNGDVASIGGIVNVGNGTVNGSVFLGPTASDNVLANGTITGGVTNDFNVDFPDVVLPKLTPLPLVSVPLAVDGVTYNYVFDNIIPFANLGGYYSINGLNGSIYVGTNTHVTLLITGSKATVTLVRVAGFGSTSGQLTVYDDAPTFTLSGQDNIDSGNALNFTYYGTTNNTTINLSGNANFTGTIYAPEANVSMSGSGSTDYDFVGSLIANSITLNGHFRFHYDENLTAAGPRQGFIPASWTEL